MKVDELVTLEFVNEVLSECEGMSLASAWSSTDFPSLTFPERIEVFCALLHRMLESGQFKLKKDGEYLTGSPEEQVQLFREAFPETDYPYPDFPDCDVSYWFFDDNCPGQAVWRGEYPDGTVEWMHCP